MTDLPVELPNLSGGCVLRLRRVPDKTCLHQEIGMSPVDQFLRHATECEHMAQSSRDPESKAVWRGMAKRWRRCAELAKTQSTSVVTSSKAKQHRKPSLSWAH